MRAISFLIWLILFFAFVVFAVLNMHTTRINFYFYSFDNIPTFIVIIASIFLGALLCFLYSVVDSFKVRMRLREKDKTIRELEKRIDELTSMMTKKTETFKEREDGDRVGEGLQS
ncbi:MAG: lipopolysaccharide assembly protein LapA domain-containing protein [candidate division WOR-3 bacterium]